MPDTAEFLEVKARLARDGEFLSRFIVNPRQTLQDSGINLTDEGEVKTLELFARTAQSQIRASADLLDIRTILPTWGIGFNCCNSSTLLPTGRPLTGQTGG